MSENQRRLKRLERDTRRSIEVRDDEDLTREEFRIVSTKDGKELTSQTND